MVILNRIGIIIVNVLVVLIVPGNQHAPHVVYGPILSGIKKRGEALTLREGWPCPKRRRDRKPCLTLQLKRKIMGALPHMARLPGGRPIKVATPRVRVPSGECPPATGHRATDHRASSYRPIVQWTKRCHGPATDQHRAQVTDHGSPATGQMGMTHEISSQSMTGHRPSSLRSLDLENLNTGELIFTDHWPLVTGQSTNGHRSTDLISTYS